MCNHMHMAICPAENSPVGPSYGLGFFFFYGFVDTLRRCVGVACLHFIIEDIILEGRAILMP